MNSETSFIKEVCDKLTKAGFNCTMMNELLVISMEEKNFEVRVWKTPGWGKHRVHFQFQFSFEGMELVEPKGLMWLVSEINNHSEYSTTYYCGDHFSCRVETSIRSSKEFVQEFDFAYKQIGRTFANMANNYPTFQEKFKVQPLHRPIGYLAGFKKEFVNKENETCGFVA